MLTGSNTYSGGTADQQWRPAESATAARAGSIVGNVLDNGTLVLNRFGQSHVVPASTQRIPAPWSSKAAGLARRVTGKQHLQRRHHGSARGHPAVGSRRYDLARPDRQRRHWGDRCPSINPRGPLPPGRHALRLAGVLHRGGQRRYDGQRDEQLPTVASHGPSTRERVAIRQLRESRPRDDLSFNGGTLQITGQYGHGH